MLCYSETTDESRALIQDNDDLETDGDDTTKHYYHKNSNSPGYIIFTVSIVHVSGCVSICTVCSC